MPSLAGKRKPTAADRLWRFLPKLLFGCLCAGAPIVQAADIASQQIDAGGLQREYLLASAAGRKASGPRPLVLLLHGHLGTAANALGRGARPSPLSAWLDIVDREDVLVAALQGTRGPDRKTGWDDCRLDSPGNPKVDDVAFAAAVVHQLVASGRADPKRVYVMGMSNGGVMAYRLAQQLHPAPAAIAAASASMARNSACKEVLPKVSVLLINGTADPIMPYAGGGVGVFGHATGNVIGAAATRDAWLRADGLEHARAVSSSFPKLPGSDGTRALKTVYGPDRGPQVEMISVQDGGHVEPSLRYHYGSLYARLVGKQNQDFESAEEAWAFFRNKAGAP